MMRLGLWGASYAAATFLVEARFRERQDLTRLAAVGRLVSDISTLIHELQRERGASSLYLGSRGAQFGSELAAQRARTAAPERRLREALDDIDVHGHGSRFVAAVRHAAAGFAEIEEGRTRVLGLQWTATESTRFFTGLIARLIGVIREAAEIAADKPISDALIAHFNLIQAKEYAGQERAIGAAGLAAGRFEPDQHRRCLALGTEQERLFQIVGGHAPPALRDALAGLAAGTAAQEVARMRQVVRDGGLAGALAGLQARDWFARATDRIEQLRGLEETLAAHLQGCCTAALARAEAACGGDFGAAGLGQRLIVALVRRRLRRYARAAARRAAAVAALRAAARTAGGGAPAGGRLVAGALAAMRGDGAAASSLAVQLQAEQQRQITRQQVLEDLVHAFGSSTDAVLAAMIQATEGVQRQARSVLSLAAATDRRCTEVADVTHEASASIQSIAAAADQLSSAIAQINGEADRAVSVAHASIADAQQTHSTVGGLADAAQHIGEVVDTIRRIAGQTNLLALNATIEAARAGEAGRGFAVVAGEVKALSSQTAQATQEIATQVSGIQDAVRNAVGAIDRIRTTITQMGQVITRIAAALAEQDGATRQITASVQQVAGGTTRVDATMGEVTSSAGETSALAGTMASASDALQGQTDTLRRHIGSFIAQVQTEYRAA
jgi:methyl-accepting chemotaxis protein